MSLEKTAGASGSTKRHEALIALGNQIRKVRQEQGFSQEDFAAKAGIDRSYYGSVERGERNIAALNLMRIAVALEVETGKLFPDSQSISKFLDGDTSPTSLQDRINSTD